MHEAQLHTQNALLTLTYKTENLPPNLSLQHRDFQLFLKRFRAKGHKVRYFMCGEYGEKNSRPHYHAVMFGYYPHDRKYWKTSDAGYKAYTSEYLDTIWQLGTVYVGDVTFESAGYVARYALKKINTDGIRRQILDVTTGELTERPHEYSEMSRRPGIGKDWFDKYQNDIFPHDRVIVRGKGLSVPKYYDKLQKAQNPCADAITKLRRVYKANTIQQYEEHAPARLRVHETVKRAAIKSLKRN